jgi:hypothetical protein
MKTVIMKFFSFLKYIMSLPYLIFGLSGLANSIKDGGLGGGLFSSGFGVFIWTLPWSLQIETLNDKMSAYVNYTSFSLDHPITYISMLGIMYFFALCLNTVILFFIGKGIYKLVQLVFHIQ